MPGLASNAMNDPWHETCDNEPRRRSPWPTVATLLLVTSVLWLAAQPRGTVTLPPREPQVPEQRARMERVPVFCQDVGSGPERAEGEPQILQCSWFVDPQPGDTEPPLEPQPNRPATQATDPRIASCTCTEVATCDPCLCSRNPAQRVITGVDSSACVGCGEPTWSLRGPIPWEAFAQGEYIGPHRYPHVHDYRLRVDDVIEFVYRLTRERSDHPYELAVGDVVQVESLSDATLNRDLEVQPDGSVTLPLLGQVMAADRTTEEVRKDLETRFKKYYKDPTITVTPIRMNTKLEDLRATVDSRMGQGGQTRLARVTPDGTVSLPALGPVPAQGLTLLELQEEINTRYDCLFDGIEVIPVLSERAPRFIYVAGDVSQPGRYELVGPTTVIQAISLAQGPNVGANLRQIVIFRRAADWRLLATKIDVRGAMYGQRPAPSDEIWLRDSDIVIVPKSPLKTTTDALSLVATNGVYAVAPFLANGFFFRETSAVVPIVPVVP